MKGKNAIGVAMFTSFCFLTLSFFNPVLKELMTKNNAQHSLCQDNEQRGWLSIFTIHLKILLFQGDFFFLVPIL